MSKMYVSATLLPKVNEPRRLKNSSEKHVRLLFECNSDDRSGMAVFNNLLRFDLHSVVNVNIVYPPKPSYSKKKYIVKRYTVKTLPVFYERWSYGPGGEGRPWIGKDHDSHETRMFNTLLRMRRQIDKM